MIKEEEIPEETTSEHGSVTENAVVPSDSAPLSAPKKKSKKASKRKQRREKAKKESSSSITDNLIELDSPHSSTHDTNATLSDESLGSEETLADSSSTEDAEEKERNKKNEAYTIYRADDLENSDGYDTDLEAEPSRTDHHNISMTKVYMEACKEFNIVPASYLCRHLTDEIIVMKHHGLGPKGAKALAIPLLSSTNVMQLDLEDNWIESAGASYLSEMLQENCYITTLNLSNNKIGYDGALAICEMLRNNSSLTSLNISNNDFHDRVSPLLAEALMESRLRELDISKNQFGDLAGELLGPAIGDNGIIEKLDISWNFIRGKSGKKLLEGIQHSVSLRIVNLAWNGIGNDGALALGECLQNNYILHELDVTNNRLTDLAIPVIAKGLEANETLRVFKIGMNSIGVTMAETLLKAINHERSVLELLDLKDVSVEKPFMTLLEEICQSRGLAVIHGRLIHDYKFKGIEEDD